MDQRVKVVYVIAGVLLIAYVALIFTETITLRQGLPLMILILLGPPVARYFIERDKG